MTRRQSRRPSRRTVLAGAWAATLAAACGAPAVPTPSLTLPPDTAAPTTAAAGGPRLLTTGAKAYFAPATLIPTGRLAYGLNQATIMPSGDVRFREMVRVSLPAAKSAPNTVPAYNDGPTYGGTRLFLAMRDYPKVEYYLRYYVRFPENFEFTKGGKLPGFYGVIVKGLQRTDSDRDGFATRFAWRKHAEGIVYANTARPDTPIDVEGKGTWTWKTNQWICVEQGVRLNTVGFAQGDLLVWINGVKVVQVHGFNPRISSKLRIGGVLFQATFGGGDRSFAPEDDQYLDLAAFAVGTARIGPIKPKKD